MPDPYIYVAWGDPPAVGYDSLYRIVGQTFADMPAVNHLPALVRLMTEIQRRGVDLSEHWDCLTEALCEEGER